MLCIKLHPPNIENAPPLNRSCTPSEPKLHPLTRFLSKLESFAKAKTPFSFEDGVLFYIIRHSMILSAAEQSAADFFLPVGRRYANIGLINRHTGEKLW